MEEETRYCDFCGNELDEDEDTWVGDELLCDECCDDHIITCDRCGETIWTQDSAEAVLKIIILGVSAVVQFCTMTL